MCIGAAGRRWEVAASAERQSCSSWRGRHPSFYRSGSDRRGLKEVGVMLLLARLAVLLVSGLASLSCGSDGEY